MPAAHRSAVERRAWRFPSLASPAVRRRCNRCAHLFSRCASAPAACTRSGFQGRSRRTACRNAARIRTSGRDPWAASLAALCRIACIARRYGFPANSLVSAPCCSRVLLAAQGPASLQVPGAALPPGRDPDIHVDGIWLPQNLPKQAGVLSRQPYPYDKCELDSICSYSRLATRYSRTQFATMKA